MMCLQIALLLPCGSRAVSLLPVECCRLLQLLHLSPQLRAVLRLPGELWRVETPSQCFSCVTWRQRWSSGNRGVVEPLSSAVAAANRALSVDTCHLSIAVFRGSNVQSIRSCNDHVVWRFVYLRTGPLEIAAAMTLATGLVFRSFMVRGLWHEKSPRACCQHAPQPSPPICNCTSFCWTL